MGWPVEDKRGRKKKFSSSPLQVDHGVPHHGLKEHHNTTKQPMVQHRYAMLINQAAVPAVDV
jgi:hypothetical protein